MRQEKRKYNQIFLMIEFDLGSFNSFRIVIFIFLFSIYLIDHYYLRKILFNQCSSAYFSIE
ncbi:hypothetical protein DERP_008067 [Dermatophagoides pteronyssinus]|uniref:Uncharacterized protein n=1 Tax=Dermatophagoides pteronyssinus TaxID=6956 RepID=A0ABQ8JJR2_DERPT|nr:hypothetical protein DERP_008067 [Dermatophagoides pteronyssinus]